MFQSWYYINIVGNIQNQHRSADINGIQKKMIKIPEFRDASKEFLKIKII